MNTQDNNPVGVLCTSDNLASKIELLYDVNSRLLADTAEITDHAELSEVVDLMRNLDELRLQLTNIIKTNQPLQQ